MRVWREEVVFVTRGGLWRWDAVARPCPGYAGYLVTGLVGRLPVVCGEVRVDGMQSAWEFTMYVPGTGAHHSSGSISQ